MKTEKVSFAMANSVGCAVAVAYMETALRHMKSIRNEFDNEIRRLESGLEFARRANEQHEIPVRENSGTDGGVTV